MIHRRPGQRSPECTTASFSHDAGPDTERPAQGQQSRGACARRRGADPLPGHIRADLVPAPGPIPRLPPFPTKTARSGNRSEAFRTVLRLAQKAHTEGRVSPHSLRNTSTLTAPPLTTASFARLAGQPRASRPPTAGGRTDHGTSWRSR